ncbi:MAG: YihA family ribosome biogenesis GTP-binding protein [Calditrichaeota bacterium]|nr:MAG: YihA family ribosome biogenesis GTP-binding protein [Calditrichota bacterium]
MAILKIHNPRFVGSLLNPAQAPRPALPEFAFVGRSNVGKSSLINTLLNRRNLARVSKQPGKTRTINYFNIDDRFYLVDLPGYGFARVGHREKHLWQKAIEDYLLQTDRLLMLYVLVDARVGAKELDVQLVAWLRHHQIPFTVVATKVDALGRSKRPGAETAIRQALVLSPDDPLIFFSAKDRTGRADLLKHMKLLLDSSR